MDARDVVGSAVDLHADSRAEDDAVEDVVVVAVDLDRGGVGRPVELLVVKVEVGLAEPAAVHHHLVAGVDLQAERREVQEVASGADRDTHDLRVRRSAKCGKVRSGVRDASGCESVRC